MPLKTANQLAIPWIKEGLNALKVLPSAIAKRPFSRPISVNLILTTNCNSKCSTCDSWKIKNHENDLRTEEFETLAVEMAAMGIPIVTLGGGEPTLRRDLVQIIQSYKARNIQVQMTTNGLTFRGELRQRILLSGVDRITFSFDSHLPDVYEKIRGVRGKETVEKNILESLQEKPHHVAIDTNTVLCRDNQDTFLDTIAYLIDKGVPKINFSAITTYEKNYLMQESKGNLFEVDLKQIEKIQMKLLDWKKTTTQISASRKYISGLTEYFMNPTKVVYPCYAGFLTLDIYQDGSVHGCGNLPSYGNVRSNSLQSIWISASAIEMRDKMRKGDCPNCYLSCKMELAIAAQPLNMPSMLIDKAF